MRKHREGQCQCGAIRYRLIGEPMVLYVCHCLHCQKQSSSAFGMSLIVEPETFEIVSGEPRQWRTAGDSGVVKVCAFCGDCGTRIYHGSGDPSEPVSIKAGTLDDLTGLEPVAHIWTSRALPWVTIDRDKYVCFDEEPSDEFDRQFRRSRNQRETRE
ncbi:MAG: GFA family protein [Gammaproteobacteria bacterium]